MPTTNPYREQDEVALLKQELAALRSSLNTYQKRAEKAEEKLNSSSRFNRWFNNLGHGTQELLMGTGAAFGIVWMIFFTVVGFGKLWQYFF